MKKFLLFCLLFFCLQTVLNAQDTERMNIKNNLHNITDSLAYIDALNRLGMLEYDNNLDSTFAYARRAESLSNKLKYAKGKADATKLIGVLVDMNGNLPLALRYYKRAYTEYKTMRDTVGMVQTMMNAGMVYNEEKNDRKAMAYFSKAITLGRHMQRDSVMSIVYTNYLILYPDKVKPAQMESYLSQAENIARNYRDTSTLLMVDQIRGVNMLRGNDTAKGVVLLKSSAEKALNMGVYYQSLDMLLALGDYYAANDSLAAAGYYKQALDVAESRKYHVYSKIIGKKLYNWYSDRKMLDTAHVYSARLIDLYDQDEVYRSHSGLDYIDYSLRETEMDKLLLKDANRKTVIAILCILFVVSCITGIVVYRLYRYREKHAHILERLNRAMQVKNRKLETDQEFNNRLISIMAHDFRQPINMVQSLANVLREDEDLTREELHELVEMMEKSSAASLDVFENILHWLKHQLSGYAYHPSELNVHELIDEAIATLQPLAMKHHIRLENTIDRHITINADKELVQFIHRNLIHNAIKFSPDHSEVIICSRSEGYNRVVSIQDSGDGISSEKLPHLFNAGSSFKYNSEKEKGAGVALVICRNFVEKMHGKIWAENGNERGGIFSYMLPEYVHA
ncbi:MAG: HAMP domain-containing histidine kinase [Mucilaginibacter polytrichastri]|nr:HAMP domain-containing histidine kinase [Mucilaginibacter polytrichastri]